ncbi:hypothetical protein EVAR_33178_1 [Eumeta japonica]|uniref:Uncharacterized protein n=1 Tax=Eumeta variegata TaxID=151549 RepID=A0A4C1W205_EUMVA|nr:hypothetical protein EVAR_33178_1 [Eumeta japonica]
MRIGIVIYWCVVAFHLCNAEDEKRTDPKEGARRAQWNPVPRSGSIVGDSSAAATNEQSSWVGIGYLMERELGDGWQSMIKGSGEWATRTLTHSKCNIGSCHFTSVFCEYGILLVKPAHLHMVAKLTTAARVMR